MESLTKKIRNCEIWLTGDRCDGWEKAIVKEQLQQYLQQSEQIKSKIEFIINDRGVSGWRWI